MFIIIEKSLIKLHVNKYFSLLFFTPYKFMDKIMLESTIHFIFPSNLQNQGKRFNKSIK